MKALRVTALRAAAAAALLAATGAGATGCAAGASTAPSIQLGNAYVPVPKVAGTTVAYVVIRNNGPADRLVSARTSAGGHVTFRTPVQAAGTAMRTVPAVTIPAHTTMSLAPDRYQLLITGVGRLRGGRAITLTLVFAQAGAVSIVASVTDPATGGSSYFLN